ncbi:MAG: [LysW]-lysine hydrolase [Anaerolineae bacterium]|nr:[LysW]-lysine hydrolase [Anaerolineae bacterium]
MNQRELLEGLLRIYSPSYQEQAAVEYLVAQMNDAGMRAFRDKAGNAVGVLGDGPRELVMLGHIDTHPGIVPVERDGELLYGRGAVDAKGPLCTFAAAAARVGARDGWKLVVVGAVEEECPTSKGAHFAKTQYDPAFAIVGEPSGWDRVTLGYKGSLWLEYTLTRENSHSAGQARSANEDAVEFWLRVKRFTDEFNTTKTKIFDRLDPTLRGMGSDNDGLHETARLVIGLRLPLDVTVTELEETLVAMAGKAKLKFDTETPAYRADKNNPLVRAFLSAIRAGGGAPGFTLKTGTSDMNVVGPHWNCPIVTYGPGDSNLDHTPNEHIDLIEYDRAVDALARVLAEITSGT